MSSLRTLLLEPLLKIENDVHLATGTRLSFGVYVHSALFDTLVSELQNEAVRGVFMPDPTNQRIGDRLYFGGLSDCWIAPERTRPREPHAADTAPVEQPR